MSITTYRNCVASRSSRRADHLGMKVRISVGVRRGDHREAGRVIGQHDFQELAVEALRARLDLVEVEARLEVEVVGAGAVLEIEVDEAGGRPRLHVAAAQEEHRRLDRKRGHAGAADGRKVGEDFRLDLIGSLGRLHDPRAGANQFRGLHRLDQKIGDPHLHQPARRLAIE